MVLTKGFTLALCDSLSGETLVKMDSFSVDAWQASFLMDFHLSICSGLSDLFVYKVNDFP